MTAIPTEIEIKILYWPDATPATEILVILSLVTTKKNDYPLGAFITDNKGIILIDKHFIENTINLMQNNYPMDYSNIPNDHYVIRAIIESKSDLKIRENRLKQFYPKDADHLSKMIDNSSNENIESTEIDIDVSSGYAQITVHKTGATEHD